MLPKLQQGPIGQTFRNVNQTSQLQCTYLHTQVRTSLKASSANKTMKATDLGKTNMPPKTLTRPLGTSPRNTLLRKSSRTLLMNQSTSSPSPAQSPNILNLLAAVAAHAARLKRRATTRSLPLNQVPSRNEMWLYPSSDATTTAGICPLRLTTRARYPNWSGRCRWSRWTIIITCLFLWTAADKNLTLTVLLR